MGTYDNRGGYPLHDPRFDEPCEDEMESEMVDVSEIKSVCDKRIESARSDLGDFKVKLDDDTWGAVHWSAGIYDCAASIQVAETIKAWVEKATERDETYLVDKLTDSVTKVALEKAMGLSHSSLETANILAIAEAKEWARWANHLGKGSLMFL